ncbi:MAG: flagellar hook-associated protein FlgL [Desulfomonilia bacterium]|jgi:flagellar hook-associated protein 3 FlgL
MRVSNRFLYHQIVKDLGKSTEKLFTLNNQLSSGKRVTKPSDDPLGLSQVLIYRSELSSFSQFQTSIDLARGWISRTETICSEIDNLLGRASELAVQQASATATVETRAGTAEEVRQLRESILNLANSKYGERYLFGGTMIQEPPFIVADVELWQEDVATMAVDHAGAVANLGGTVSAGDRYINTADGNIYEYDGSSWQVSTAAAEGISAVVSDRGKLYVLSGGQWVPQYRGNTSSFSVKIGKEDTIAINIPGRELFANPQGDVIMTLMKLEKALRENDQQAIRDSLGDIKSSEDVVLNNIAKIGALVNRLDNSKGIIRNAEVDIKERVSNIEELDYAYAYTQLISQQTIYEASLKSTALITSLSLVDFI